MASHFHPRPQITTWTDHLSQLAGSGKDFANKRLVQESLLSFFLGRRSHQVNIEHIPFSSQCHIFLLPISDNFVEIFALNLQISCRLLSQNLILSAAADSTGWNGFLITELEFLGSFCNVIGYLLSVICYLKRKSELSSGEHLHYYYIKPPTYLHIHRNFKRSFRQCSCLT